MPTPKRKQSKSKRGNRRAHDKLVNPATSTCPECGEAKRPHNVCGNCGTYRGRTIVANDEIA